MKIILSRKGYDDKYGGKPSIILPDSNEMISFPIPVTNEIGESSSKIIILNTSLEQYFEELGHKNVKQIHHLDPDVRNEDGLKKIGAFGQSGAALSHLLGNNVGKGDIFFFFGTFCKTYYVNGKLTYESMIPFHSIWGYLEVDKIVDPKTISSSYQSELLAHPHYLNRNNKKYDNGNAIFIGKNFGTFKFHEKLRLSKIGYKKTCWSLPSYFKQVEITYNKEQHYGIQTDNRYETVSASIGQEFIIDLDEEKDIEIVTWAKDIIKTCI